MDTEEQVRMKPGTVDDEGDFLKTAEGNFTF
jgi:hypothetical protein